VQDLPHEQQQERDGQHIAQRACGEGQPGIQSLRNAIGDAAAQLHDRQQRNEKRHHAFAKDGAEQPIDHRFSSPFRNVPSV